MKILIDFTQIPLNKVGVGVYAINTFTNIFKYDKANTYFAVIQSDDKQLKSLFSNIHCISINSKFSRLMIIRLIIEQIYIPFLILKYKIDIIHSLHYSFPLLSFKAKRVTTIHDLTFFLYPKLHTFIKRHYFRLFTKLATILCDGIICVSNSTAKDLNEIFPKIKAKINIIPLAFNKPTNIKNLQSSFKIDFEYILFIGTLEPRKNLLNLIEAYNKISNETQCDLIIVGGKGWFYNSIFQKVKNLKIEKRTHFLGFIDDDEKFYLLDNCKMFVYPSIYEGFGLPILEAISFNKPTITSNISAMPEVAGNAAILINPLSIEDIEQAMRNILNSPELENKLIKRCQAQAKKFSWEDTANKTINAYKTLQ